MGTPKKRSRQLWYLASKSPKQFGDIDKNIFPETFGVYFGVLSIFSLETQF